LAVKVGRAVPLHAGSEGGRPASCPPVGGTRPVTSLPIRILNQTRRPVATQGRHSESVQWRTRCLCSIYPRTPSNVVGLRSYILRKPNCAFLQVHFLGAPRCAVGRWASRESTKGVRRMKIKHRSYPRQPWGLRSDLARSSAFAFRKVTIM